MQILKGMPPGVKTLGTLAIGASVLYIFNVFGAVVISIFSNSFANHTFNIDLTVLSSSLLLGPLTSVSNVILILIGVANMAAAIVMLKGKIWSWNVGLAVSCIGVAFAVILTLMEQGRPALESLAMNAALMGISGAIVVHLFKPDVRAFFGKFISEYDGDPDSDYGYAMDNTAAAE